MTHVAMTHSAERPADHGLRHGQPRQPTRVFVSPRSAPHFPRGTEGPQGGAGVARQSSPAFEGVSSSPRRASRRSAAHEFHISAQGAPFRLPKDFVLRAASVPEVGVGEQASAQPSGFPVSGPLRGTSIRGFGSGSLSSSHLRAASPRRATARLSPAAERAKVQRASSISGPQLNSSTSTLYSSPKVLPQPGLAPSPRAWYCGGRGDRRGSMSTFGGGHTHYFAQKRPRTFMPKVKDHSASTVDALKERAARMAKNKQETRRRLMGEQFVFALPQAVPGHRHPNMQ